MISKKHFLTVFVNEPGLFFAHSYMVSIFAALYSQFNISHLFGRTLFYLTHIMTLSCDTTPSQSGPESNGNEEVIHIHQMPKAGASPLNCLMSYPGHSF